MPLDVRNCTTLAEFKNKISTKVPRSLKLTELYYVGNRFAAVLHTRLRLGHSQLNSHLFDIGVTQSPKCRCDQGIEDTWHFFFVCPFYSVFRDCLHRIVINYAPFGLETVLYGFSESTLENNKKIFLAVQDYILKTKRFRTGAVT